MKKENDLNLFEKKLKRQYQTLPIPIYIWKKKGDDFILIACNEAAIKNTRGHITEFLHKKASEVITDRPKFIQDLAACYTKKETLIREIPFKFVKQDELRDLKVTSFFVAPCYVVVHTEDITEHVKTKSRLQETERRYAALFNHAADTIVLVDAATGKIVDFNTMAYKNLGYTRQEFQQMTISDFEAGESPEEVKNHIKRIAKQGSDIFETKQRAKTGEIRDIQVNATKISIQGKEYLHSIWRDITKLKQMEEANKKLSIEAEKAKMLDKIKEKNALLEEKNAALRQVMEQVKVERKRVEEQIRDNVVEIILPTIHKLRGKCHEPAIKYLDILEENFKTLTSSFGFTVSRVPVKLTAREIDVCNMIRNGLSSKEISSLLNNSYKTIEKQRKIIRKKLGITDRAVNLASYLKNIE